eukprot:11279167-Alexandrium_andersonii.AAC.1
MRAIPEAPLGSALLHPETSMQHTCKSAAHCCLEFSGGPGDFQYVPAPFSSSAAGTWRSTR